MCVFVCVCVCVSRQYNHGHDLYMTNRRHDQRGGVEESREEEGWLIKYQCSGLEIVPLTLPIRSIRNERLIAIHP